jgi:anthranilate synthase/aminodeoxychorismate synthase-like glutamine amidotransferase
MVAFCTACRDQSDGSMTRVLVVDHYDSYTYNLVHLIAEVTGVLPEVVEHDRVSARDLLRAPYSHFVLSPGPGHPSQLHDFAVGRDLIEQSDRPLLGVCLGMQGLVLAYGGTVDRVDPAHGEVAVVEHNAHAMFRGVPQRFRAVRYHSLAATVVPEALEVTATCEADGGGSVVMSVAHRERPQYGVQFHPESILTEHGREIIAAFVEA